jgi:hypothetical protein
MNLRENIIEKKIETWFAGEIVIRMDIKKSTITLTFGDSAENHVGMEQLGKRVEAGKGFTCDELLAIQSELEEYDITCEYHSLNTVPKTAAASALIIKDGVNKLLGSVDAAKKMFEEQACLNVDKHAFMYGRVVNKHARWNLCFDDFDQEPEYSAGKGRVINLDKLPLTTALYKVLPEFFGEKANELKGEGNYYYDISKCGIGFHGDSERRKVIGVRLGAPLPLHYQWFQEGKPVGERIILPLNGGDIYIMSEKAVGTDWKSKKILTLRHATGCDKFTKID